MAEAFFTGRMSLPPGINQSYKPIALSSVNRLTGERKTYASIGSTPALKAFKEVAAWELKTAQMDMMAVQRIQKAWRKKAPIPLTLTLIFYYDNLWVYDEDSGIKAVQDALCKHAQINDVLIVDLSVKKRASADPHVEFALAEIDEQV